VIIVNKINRVENEGIFWLFGGSGDLFIKIFFRQAQQTAKMIPHFSSNCAKYFMPIVSWIAKLRLHSHSLLFLFGI
jgi:hypothetical protein